MKTFCKYDQSIKYNRCSGGQPHGAVVSSQFNMPSAGSQCYLAVCTLLVLCEVEQVS